MDRSILRGLFVCALLGAAVTSAAGHALAADPTVTVLDASSNWRVFPMWKTLLFRRASGALEPEKAGTAVTHTALPPAAWAAPDFDDADWPTIRSTIPQQGADLALLCLRNTFRVDDPAAAKGLTLSLAYYGGAVVYVNGRELARGHMPKDKIGPETPAHDYPKDAYVDPEGFLLRRQWGDPQKYPDRFRLRTRHLTDVAVPAGMLRRGVNVIAVEIHRAPTSEVMLTGKPRLWQRERWRGRGYWWWSMLAFEGVSLTAPPGAGAISNARRPEGVQVWTAAVTEEFTDSEFGDRNRPLGTIRLTGARNGVFSGQVLVGSSAALKGLKAVAGPLKSAGGMIPATAVEVRYAHKSGRRFDVLDTAAPADAPKGIAAQPIWVTVSVPKDAAAGVYSGAVTVSAEGLEPTPVPIQLRVHDFALPDPKAFRSFVGLVQSPDTLAVQYNVPMWSEKHWALIDRSFQWIGRVGGNVIFIPLIRHTHYGNEHSMVRWVKDGEGFIYDFSIVERYLDTALKHLGTVPVVCAYCWEPYQGSAYLGGKARKGKGMLYSVLDPKTGALTPAEGPKWGDPQVRAFWKPVFEGLRERLADRGLADALMVGVAGDSRPNKDAVEDLKAAAFNVPWVLNSHGTASALHGQPVGHWADVWASPSAPDPAKKRLYGWRGSFLATTFPRAGSNTVGPIGIRSPFVQYRLAIEGMLAAGIHGVGRVGADFWPAIKDKRGRRRDLLGRYPESGWAQLNLRNSFAYILAPGPDGAIGTIRFEMLREGVQDAEARVVIEQALLSPARRARLGDDLAARAQAVLDQRVRDINHAKRRSALRWLWYGGGMPERSEALFAVVAEVAAHLRS